MFIFLTVSSVKYLVVTCQRTVQQKDVISLVTTFTVTGLGTCRFWTSILLLSILTNVLVNGLSLNDLKD